MKSLINIINEKLILSKTKNKIKSFILSDNERNALCIFLGFCFGYIGTDSDIKKFEKFIQSLSDEECKKLDEIYEMTADHNIYNEITHKQFDITDIELINMLLDYIEENDYYDDFEYELSNIKEKIN
jgi:hypothetical protein